MRTPASGLPSLQRGRTKGGWVGWSREKSPVGTADLRLVQIRLEREAGGFHLVITAYGSGRVPHVRPSVHGPKMDFSNALTPCTGILALGRSLFALVAIALEGAAPHKR